MHERLPYLGITDIPSRHMADVLYDHFISFLRPDVERHLHFGVMMSRKTLLGAPTKWSTIFPKMEQVSSILSHPHAYNCVHYADYGDLGVDLNLSSTLSCVADYGGSRLDAIQLDMIWPDVEQLVQFKKTHECELILQIGRRAFVEIGYSAAAFIEKLRFYEGVVERLLFDTSGGEGKALHAEMLLHFLYQTEEDLPGFSLGVAGGLGPHSMQLLGPILTDFPRISIDAQGQLRASGNAMDPLDLWRSEKYIEEALCVLDRDTRVMRN